MNPLVSNTSLDMTIVQGNSRDIVFNVKGSGFSGIDLDNVSTIRWSFFRSLENSNPITVKTLGSGISIEDVDGVFIVSLIPDDTEDVQQGAYFHEAVIVMDDDSVYTVVNKMGMPGKFNVRKIGTLP